MSALPIVVSLAVMRARLGMLDAVLGSLLAQSLAPAKIVLNVSRRPYLLDEGLDFEDLPEGVRRLVAAGKVELYFTENTGPYRKILPTLRRYGHRPFLLATADDDVIYPMHWLAGLHKAMAGGPCVAAYRVRAMAVHQGRLRAYNDWPIVHADCVDPAEIRPSSRDLLLFPTGRGGVMYDSRVFAELGVVEQLRTLAPAQDDLALRFTTLLGRIPVRCVHWSEAGASGWEFPAAAPSGINLFDVVNARGGNDEALHRLLFALAQSGLWRLEDHLMAAPLAAAS